MPRQDLIQIRRGTAAQWTSADPTLASGEIGFETDTWKLKIGDGSTAWSSLSYITGGDSVQNKYDATAAPTATDDTSEGYSVGSKWVDVTNDNAYICVDATEDAAVWEQINGGSGGGSLEYQTEITTDTTLDGTQKGLNKVYPVNSATAKEITITTGDYVENDVINIERRGQGIVEIIADTGVRIRGVRDVNNRYFINDPNSMVALLCRGSEEFAIIGNLKRGYTGAVTTISYGELESSETADVPVTGTGFSANMLVSLSGNATLNSWTYVNNNNITLNITSSGTDGDFLTVTYDNGDVFVDTDCIELTDAPATSIVLETTSTSASWSPSGVNNSGSTLKWTVTGDATGIYDANDPTIDLSGNTGTAIITITSADNLAGLTTCRFSNLSITEADVSAWTACTQLWFAVNAGLTEIVGTENLTNCTYFNLIQNNLSTLELPTGTTLTELQLDYNPLTSITGLSSATGLEILDINNNSSITSIDLTSNTALTSFTASSCSNFSSITGLSSLSNLETLNIASCDFDTIDLTGATSLDNVRLQTNSLDVTSINNVILDLDSFGVSNGTLNYSNQSPTADPTATENTTNDVLDAYNALNGDGWTITGSTPA
jgi:hypothetical protein